MEDSNENSLNKHLLKLLDIETNKKATEIDTDKVSSIVKLMDSLNATENQDKGESLNKFIYKFNKYHKTNLTNDIRKVRRKMKYVHTLTLLGILIPVFLLVGFVIGKIEKK